MFNLIVAQDEKGGISLDEALPFKCSEDMKHFRETTEYSVVIMGRKTWDSLPVKPLPNRVNIVMSRTKGSVTSAFVRWASSLNEILTMMQEYPEQKKFVIGGRQIYEMFLERNLVNRMYITTIPENCHADLRFPPIRQENWKMVYEKVLSLSPYVMMKVYDRYNFEEKQFLGTLNNILTRGVRKKDRTGVGTLSTFGEQLRFSLEDGRFPLLTHRRVPLRMAFEELMWMIRGQTDAKILAEKKVNIWNDNTTRKFLDGRGLKWEVGDIGPAYGFQLRHYGAKYYGCHHNYAGKGFDQLANVIHLLKNDPSSRRIMFTFWNPADLCKMALPPCAFNYQFYVSGKWLSCKLTQRSSDISLAGGWNIATASLWTYMLAKICGLRPKEVIWSTGDTHIYMNQVAAVKEMVQREPNPFPTIFLKSPKDNYIENFEWSDIILQDYRPQKKIKVAMNA